MQFDKMDLEAYLNDAADADVLQGVEAELKAGNRELAQQLDALLTRDDIVTFIAKESSATKRTVIKLLREDPESFASIWVAEIYRRIANPEKVAWGKLID